MELLITVFGAILAVFIVIVLHEAGHFLVAKMLGVKVLRFSVGFGKAIWSYQSRRSGTEYVIAILPLGGYVKMLDDRELQVSYQESKMAYNRQPLLTRMAIVLAGPLTNFLLAIIAFWMVFLLGISYVKPVIGKVLPDSIAGQAGLKAGDAIKAIDGEKVYEWQQVFTDIIGRIGNKEEISLTVQPADRAALQTRYLSLTNWKLVGNQPDILKSLGIVPYRPEFPAIVSKILPNSPAAIKGLQKNDQIIAIDGKSMTEWPDLMDYIKNRPHQEITLTIQRDQSQQQVTVELGSKQQNGQNTGFLGVEVKLPSWPAGMIETPKFSIFSAWRPAINQTWSLIAFNYIVLEKMILGKISVATLGGPITIFRTAGAASQQGLRVYLSFIAFISVTLGFINILPIPGLDGGHFLFQVIESIIRKPISEKYQALLLRFGILLIILLIIQGTINDIVRLF